MQMKFILPFLPFLVRVVPQIFMTGIPSALAYDPLVARLGFTSTDALLILGVFMLIFSIIAVRNCWKDRKLAVAEVLADGYFINFIEKLEEGLFNNNEVLVNGTAMPVKEIRMLIPTDDAQLHKGRTEFPSRTIPAGYLSAQHGRRTVAAKMEVDGLVLYDVPSTLYPLPEHLMIERLVPMGEPVPQEYFTVFRKRLRDQYKRRFGSRKGFSQWLDVERVPLP